MLTRNAEARSQAAARAGNDGGARWPAGRSLAGGEAEGVLRLVILGDHPDVVSPGADQFFLGLQVLEGGADAGFSPLAREPGGGVGGGESGAGEVELAGEGPDADVLLHHLAADGILEKFLGDPGLAFAGGGLAFPVRVEESAGANPPGEAEGEVAAEAPVAGEAGAGGASAEAPEGRLRANGGHEGSDLRAAAGEAVA